jgi:predicted GNAT family acetyltransferase
MITIARAVEADAVAEAHVDHYAANTAAGQLYERCGFLPRNISRVHPY